MGLVWLISANGDNSKALLVQPLSIGDGGCLPDGDVWQAALNNSGLDRLRKRWQQAKHPSVFFQIQTLSHTSTVSQQAEPVDPQQSDLGTPTLTVSAPCKNAVSQHQQWRWAVHAPGKDAHRRQWSANPAQLKLLRLLKGLRMGVCPVLVATNDKHIECIHPLLLLSPGQDWPHDKQGNWKAWIPQGRIWTLAIAVALFQAGTAFLWPQSVVTQSVTAGYSRLSAPSTEDGYSRGAHHGRH